MGSPSQNIARLNRSARSAARRRARRHGRHGHKLSGSQMRSLAFGYGGDPLAVWRRASRSQRSRIKRAARREGVTVQAWIRGGPKALRERGQSGLTRTAQRTISAAYAPEVNELNQEDKRVRNLEDKREIDQRYYDQWLSTKQAEINASAQAADAAVLSSAQHEQDVIGQRFQQEEGRRRSQVAGQGGLVSGSALGQYAQFDTSSEEERATSRQAAVGQRTREAVSTGAMTRQLGSQALNAQSLANVRRFRQDELDSLKELGLKWKDMRLRRAGDIAKEIARLNTEEISKAQSASELNLAASKLGVEAADKRTKNRLAKRKFGLDYKKYLHSIRKDKATHRLRQIALRIQQGNLTERQRHNLRQEAAALRRIAKTGSGGGGGGGGGGHSKDYTKSFNKAYSAIRIAGGSSKGNPGSRKWRLGVIDQLINRGLDAGAVKRAMRRYYRRWRKRHRRSPNNPPNAKGGPLGQRPR